MAAAKVTNKGNWDALKNNPSLGNTYSGVAGDYYTATSKAQVNLGYGKLDISIGDQVVWNGSYWEPFWNTSSNGIATESYVTAAIGAAGELNIDADSGSPQVIDLIAPETMTIAGGTLIDTVVGSPANGITVSHDVTGMASGTVGNATTIPVLTFSQGHVTSIGTASISTTDSYATTVSITGTDTKTVLLTGVGSFGTPSDTINFSLEQVCNIGATTDGNITAATGFYATDGRFQLTGGSNRMTIGNDINFYVGASGAGNNYMRINASGELHVEDDIIGFSTSVSDPRLKDFIDRIESPLEKVMALNGYKFKWKHNDRVDYGFSADEVELVLPEAVKIHKDELNKYHIDEYKTFNDVAVLALHNDAIKALADRVDYLESILNSNGIPT